MLEDVHIKGKGVIAENPKFSEEQIGISKPEAKAKLRRLVEEFGSNLFTTGKLYPKWME